MNNTEPEAVKIRCPLCPWESEEVTVKPGPNGVWWAFKEAGTGWHRHFDLHRPAPIRVLIYPDQGLDEPAG